MVIRLHLILYSFASSRLRWQFLNRVVNLRLWLFFYDFNALFFIVRLLFILPFELRCHWDPSLVRENRFWGNHLLLFTVTISYRSWLRSQVIIQNCLFFFIRSAPYRDLFIDIFVLFWAGLQFSLGLFRYFWLVWNLYLDFLLFCWGFLRFCKRWWILELLVWLFCEVYNFRLLIQGTNCSIWQKLSCASFEKRFRLFWGWHW